MIRKSFLIGAVLAITGASAVGAAETVVLEPVADAAIYEEGDFANGSGSYLFAGRTENRNGAVERRSLIAFDIAGAVPAGAAITEVSLELTMSRTISGSQTVELRRVIESWSEGPSDAPGQEGAGAAAGAGDVTWMHREFPNSTWMMPGGSTSSGSASASQQVANTGPYSFGSSSEMVSDVQAWLDGSADNFGWALLIPSSAVGSAKRFNSRENSDQSSRPKLTVTYEIDEAPPLTERYVFPASNAAGSGTSFFITTADILNGGPTAASVRIQLLRRETDNTNGLQSALFTLEPGEVRRFDNVIGDAFGPDGDGVAGGVTVLSDSDQLVVMSRTFNRVDEGTIGAALPGVSDAELVQAGQRVRIVFLTENDGSDPTSG